MPWADQVITAYDHTDVQVWVGDAPNRGLGYAWCDVIGTIGDKTHDGFETSKMVITRSNLDGGMYKDLKIQIYTNFFPAFEYSIQPADIVLNGTYGIAMSNHDGFTQGTLYKDATFKTSIDLWGPGSGYYYGGAYAVHPGAALPLPGGNNDTHGATSTAYTYLKTGTQVKAGTLTWVLDSNPLDPNRYLVTVDLPGYNKALDAGLQPINLFWGTGTCSNDGIIAVPLPPSLLLLGSGLLGLALLRGRKLFKA